MDLQVKDIIQNELTTYCKPRTGSESRAGCYAGVDAPMTTVQFRVHLEDSVSGFKANSWELDSVEKATVIDMGMIAYTNTYADWVKLPLPTEATPKLKAWQDEARKTGV